jgi:hypothetical protein
VATKTRQIQADLGPEPSDAEAAFLDQAYDIIVVQNFFGSLRQQSVTKRKALLLRLAEGLSEGGSLLVIDSSSLGRAQELHQLVSKTVESGDYHAFGPCPSLFGNPSGVGCYSCSAGQQRGIVQPRYLEYLCRASSQYDFDALSAANRWSYAVLRKAPGSVAPEIHGDRTQYLSLGSLFEGPSPERVNLLLTVASQDASRPGRIKGCDQSCGAESCTLVVPAGIQHPPLERGDVLRVDNVRLERHEDEDEGTVRFDLLVDEQTSITDLSHAERTVTWRDALGGIGYHA